MRCEECVSHRGRFLTHARSERANLLSSFLCITRQISGDTGPPVSIFLSLYLAGDPSRVADPFFTSPFLTEAPAPFFPFFSRSGSRSFPGAENVFLFLPDTAAFALSIDEPW